MKDDAPKTFVTSASEKVTALGGSIHQTYRHAVRGFAATLSPSAVAQLRTDPNVAYIEADSTVTVTATQTNPPWGLDRIDQRNRPLSRSYTYNTTGSGVTSYIIDTGIRASHQQFGGRAVSGYTAINDGRGTTDCNGHGTHVAGTVGGSTYGVAKGTRLVAVRVLSCTGSGSNSGVIAGVDWVTGNHQAGRPATANMSLGGGASTALDSAVSRSISDGVTYVVAAGNSNANACNSSPARVRAAITVGSTTSSDARSSFSNVGSCVDLFAPGSSILSAWYTSNTATNTISGTSMASPHVAGAAARYLQSNTSASPATVSNAIVSNATTGVVSNPGSGSPNRLLYVAP
jgi:subtilisin family serine protease